MSENLKLNLQTKSLIQNKEGYNVWKNNINTVEVPADKTSIIICDMWDDHWSRGAAEREEKMVKPMNKIIKKARQKGVKIIHSPSDTMEFYKDHPARQRIKNIKLVNPPEEKDYEEVPLPIDDSDGGSDTGEKPWEKVWKRQHPGLEIDSGKDVISDNGKEIFSFIKQNKTTQVLIMGVHVNMCILERPFAIKQMVKWGVDIALVRDFTDAMYNPARSPYVSHKRGTELVIEYIEKFWCPTIKSSDL